MASSPTKSSNIGVVLSSGGPKILRRTRGDSQLLKASGSREDAPQKARLVQIDFLRGIAILLVIGCHWVQPPQEAGRLQFLSEAWVRFGWSGVDLFFVLSGFLVGGLLFKELNQHGRINLGRFMVRRGFKIWPSYYLYLIYYFAYLMHRDHISAKTTLALLLPNLFHLQNYVTGHTLGQPAFWNFNLRHTWSLAVEEHFYLLLPLLLIALSGKNLAGLKTRLPLVTALVVAVCLGLRWLAVEGPGTASLPLEATHLRIDSLLIGVLLASLYHLSPLWLAGIARPRVLLVFGLMLVSPFALFGFSTRFTGTVGYSLLAFGYSCLLLAIVQAQSTLAQRFLASIPVRLIAFVGTYSYSIYLWHLALGQILPKWLVKHGVMASHVEIRWLLIMGVYILSSILVGVLFGKLVEYPALALRDRLFPSLAKGSITPMMVFSKTDGDRFSAPVTHSGVIIP